MARTFDGSTNDQSLFSTGFTDPGFPLTMACWAYWTGTGDNDDTLMQIQNNGTSFDYYRLSRDQQTPNIVQALTSDSANFAEALSSTTFTANTWFHACATFTGATSLTAHVNNGASDSATGGGGTPASVNSIAIGREMDSSTADSWTGDIAEAAVWNVVLSSAERQMLADGASPLLVRPDALVFYAPCVRGTTASGGTDFDYIGGLTLTNQGTGTVGVAPHPPIIRPSAQILQFPPPAAAGGLSIPVAMNSYRQRHQFSMG